VRPVPTPLALSRESALPSREGSDAALDVHMERGWRAVSLSNSKGSGTPSDQLRVE